MFRKLAVGVGLAVVLGSSLVAREARAFPGIRSSRSIGQSVRQGREQRRIAWPPRMPSRQRPDARPGKAGGFGRFGDAFMVDTSVVLGPMISVNSFFGAASNGEGFRVLWHDGNLYRTSGIGPDGSLHDGRGVVTGGFSPYLYSVETREIAATGEGFVAVWTYGGTGIAGATLDSTGQPVDSFFVFESDSGQAEPAVAFDGDSTSLVAWTESPEGDPDIYAARVTSSGRVLDSVPIHVTDDSIESETAPCVAYGQGVYIVTWTASDMGAFAKAVRVSREGAVLDTAIFLRRDSLAIQAYPTVTFGDTCFLAVWSEGLDQPDICAARLSASGTLIDSAVQLTDSPDFEIYASVAFDGTRYLAMWNDMDITTYDFSLGGRRLTADGSPLDSAIIQPQIPGYDCVYPGVAADGANFLVGFTVQDTIAYAYGVCCVRVSPEGAVLDSGIFLPLGPDAQIMPSVATDGTDFLAAWLESRANRWVVSAARITADGTVLDPAGIQVSRTPSEIYRVAAAFGDSTYIVAWADHLGSKDDIFCARVAMDGSVLDPDGILVCSDSTGRDEPDVSFDGQNFLVVWQDARSTTDCDVYAARVSPAGAVLDPNGFAVDVSNKYDDYSPTVCYVGPDYLITWHGRETSSFESDIYGALVTPGGGVVENRFVVSAAAGDQSYPLVAAGPSCALVAWEDSRQSRSDLYAARVSADGTVLDTGGFVIAASDDEKHGPCLAADADGFRVVWSRGSYTSDTTTFVAARIDTAGQVTRTGDWFAVPGSYEGHDVAYTGGPELLLLFSWFTDSALGRDYGAFRVWGRFGAVPGIEQAGGLPRSHRYGASVVRGVLWLPPATGHKPQAACLLDISGRKVKDLGSGANDVSGLAPGVYFVRELSEERAVPSTTKVVLAR